MKRETLRAADFLPGVSAGNRRERGPEFRSTDLRPANLTDGQEAAVVRVFKELGRRRKA